MVYEKKKSGDPDYDDKVPANEHTGLTVKAGDGTPIGRVDPAVGPVDMDGAHLNVHTSPEDLDTRPAPGEVAEVKAEVQTYTREDVPTEDISVDELKTAESDESHQSSGDAKAAENQLAMAAGQPVAPVKTAPAKTAPAKSTSSSSSKSDAGN
jgi:hypothetical protein